MTRKTYQIEFVKCTSSACDHCSKSTIQPKKFFNFLKQNDGMVPTPEVSTVHSGHYTSLLQHVKTPLVRDFKEHLPSLKGKSKAACTNGRCQYIFNSKADEKCHSILMSHKRK